jgi:hypothetical protein
MSEALPNREQELSLHRRLFDGDPVASADLASSYLNPLIAQLSKQNRVADDLIEEAAEEALVSLIKNPGSFNASRNKSDRPLFAYLLMSARRDLQNLLARENRRRCRFVRLESVEHSPDGGKYLSRHDDPSAALMLQEEAEQASRRLLPGVRDGLNDGELAALELLLQGERKTALYARALRIEHLPKKEQAAQVKRVKDKLNRRLERGSHGHAT